MHDTQSAWQTANLHLQITERGERPADKDWPFLLNLGRNFFQQPQKSSDAIRRGERKRQTKTERERERKWGGSQRPKQREEQMRRRATPPWFQWKQVNKSKQAAQKLALMAVECGWSYLPVCVCVCICDCEARAARRRLLSYGRQQGRGSWPRRDAALHRPSRL